MANMEELWRTRECHCLRARREARELTRLYEERLREHGLRATQFTILAALSLKGATPVGELAETLGLERTSLTRSAGVLERNGWIEAVQASDARTRPLQLTAEGRRKLDAAYPAWREVQDQVDRGGWHRPGPVGEPRARGVDPKEEGKA